MKAPVKAKVLIDGVVMGEIEAEVEIPENDEKNNEEFDKNLELILKAEILTDDTFKQFVSYMITKEANAPGCTATAAELTDKFFNERFKLEITI